jgi:hypothetical protein
LRREILNSSAVNLTSIPLHVFAAQQTLGTIVGKILNLRNLNRHPPECMSAFLYYGRMLVVANEQIARE